MVEAKIVNGEWGALNGKWHPCGGVQIVDGEEGKWFAER